MEMKEIIFMLVACGFIVNADELVCIPGVCRRVQCPDIAPCTSNQILVKRATHCRCCSVCVPLLKLGDACLRIKRSPVTGRCLRGLRCINRRCSIPRPHSRRHR